MYIHAYQSLVWNTMVSHRLEDYDATAAVEGDLVLPGRDNWDLRNKGADLDPEEAAQDGAQPVDEATEGAHKRGEVKPLVVTAEDAAGGVYGIEDVVLPLPGMEVLYPTHGIGDRYRERLEQDGVAEVVANGHKQREYSLAGAYRYMIARPRDLEWKILHYDDPQEDLSRNDLDVLENKPSRDEAASGSLKALQMAFSLPSSTYATMLLREVMKTSTSASFHRNKEIGTAAAAAATMATVGEASSGEEAAAPQEAAEGQQGGVSP